jgi:hypothetical protein
MPKMPRRFGRGDKVIVRPESDSPLKGQIGIVDQIISDAKEMGYFYSVKFAGVAMRFNEDLLEVAH